MLSLLSKIVAQGPLQLLLAKVICNAQMQDTRAVKTFAQIVLPLWAGDTVTFVVMGPNKLWHEMGWLWVLLHVLATCLGLFAVVCLVVQHRTREGLSIESLLAVGHSVLHRSLTAVLLFNLIVALAR